MHCTVTFDDAEEVLSNSILAILDFDRWLSRNSLSKEGGTISREIELPNRSLRISWSI